MALIFGFNPTTRRAIDQSAGGKLRNRNAKESWALLEDLALYDNESWNDPRDFTKPVKAISLPQDVLITFDRRLIELENQVQRLMEAHLAPKQLIQEDEAKEEGSVKSSVTEYKDHEMIVKSEEEFEGEIEEETKEEEEDNPEHFDAFPTMKELGYYEWLLKNPRPPWVKAKIRTENLKNVKFSCMIGHFDKKQAYLVVESPINVMSRLHYNWIMSNRLEPRRKPLNLKKICNFVGRIRGLKIFIRNFTYECDFMVLKDTTSVLDHDL
ncbi:hypothetical protein Tco_1478172, partial [Tanacetum coccineum]